jgi:cytochrome c nitrite reductase small subunit
MAWFRRSSSSVTPASGRKRTSRRRWAIAAAIAVGLALGLGGFTFVYARGASYLTNNPEACGNCHIMREHLEGWVKSSHKGVATCNDCHTPHTPVGKYVTKARNGFWHSFYFTTGRFPDPLRITESNRRVTEGACRHCHAAIVDAIDPPARAQPADTAASSRSDRKPHGAGADQLSCVQCHRYVGHLVR